MKNFRSLLDLTFWDKSGHSFWGLKRKEAKKVANVFIVIGFLLADPPFSILPTDFINMWIAGQISKLVTVLDFKTALVITYTVIAWGLILTGVWIYPYNSRSLLNGYINKIKKAMKKALKEPIYILIGLIIFYIMFKWYSGVL